MSGPRLPGELAGLGAMLGLAVLAARYLSLDRDVKRLRDWSGRAREARSRPSDDGRRGGLSAARRRVGAGLTPRHVFTAAIGLLVFGSGAYGAIS
jgi:hypothetical protein